MRRRLVLFLRLPRYGGGKRRLASEIGDLAALRFERLMIARLLRRLRDPRWRLGIAVTPDRACRTAARWCPGVAVIPQGGGDLGGRMCRALAGAMPGPALLVGADIPQLSTHHIARAFRLLGQYDLVFGPATDGGFWLVGMRHPRPRLRLFDNVRWSGPFALADTLSGLPPALSIGFADPLEDVDDASAWRRLKPRRGF
jgi:rSAM/selenodomain-associated transferase 1